MNISRHGSAQSARRVPVGAAALLVIGSIVVFGTSSWRESRRGGQVDGPLTLGGEAYVAKQIVPNVPEASTWVAPQPQSRGRDWVYDAFTPPEIFFHARTRQFAVTPPDGAIENGPAPDAFALELIAVQPRPFRLQLIGYAGGDGKWRGTFQNLETGELLVAGEGREIASLGLSIRAFDVRAQPVAPAESMTTQQRVAFAVVHDRKTGCDVTLTDRERRAGDALFARVAIASETATRELRLGEKFEAGGHTYRVDHIRLSPPTVDVTREAGAGAAAERRMLSVRGATGSVAEASDGL